MARGVNKVILIGVLGQDPDIKYTSDGKAVANISVATNESWTDKNTGERQEHTEWHRVVAFQRLAEIMGEHIRKGSKVYIEGKLQTNKWQDKDGNDRYTTQVVANNMQMLGGRDSSSDDSNTTANKSNKPPAQQHKQSSKPSTQQKGFDDFDDDIPF